MPGLILFFLIGKFYYNMAISNNRNKWGYAILGIVAYFVGAILAVMVIGIISEITGNILLMEEDNLTTVGLTLGLLTCYGGYKYLQYRWNKTPYSSYKEGMLDEELLR